MVQLGRNRGRSRNPAQVKSMLASGFALFALLVIAAYALLGPTGIIAWTDYRSALKDRSAELAKLEKERDALRNKQRLLDPDNVDEDLAGEYLRRDLNVVPPGEVIVPLKNE